MASDHDEVVEDRVAGLSIEACFCKMIPNRRDRLKDVAKA
jgi:hypothetical protein